MNYFLVDYENVHTDGVSKTSLVGDGDTVIIMYSENSKNIALDAINELLAKGAVIKCYKVSVGTKNALDFQLSSYLGYIIGKETVHNSSFYIVSKDTGYDRLCEFWTAQNIDVKRIHNMSGDIVEQQVQAPPKEKKAKKAKKNKGSRVQ